MAAGLRSAVPCCVSREFIPPKGRLPQEPPQYPQQEQHHLVDGLSDGPAAEPGERLHRLHSRHHQQQIR